MFLTLLSLFSSLVLDADVMLSSDRIVLDRFVVEMSGRLRLDKLAQLIEAFLLKSFKKIEHDQEHQDDCSCQDASQTQSLSATGALYFNPPAQRQSSNNLSHRDLREEIEGAVSLTEVLASPHNQVEQKLDPNYETLKRHFSMPNELAIRAFGAGGIMGGKHRASLNNILTPSLNSSRHSQPTIPPEDGVHLLPRPGHHHQHTCDTCGEVNSATNGLDEEVTSMRQKRPLVNRRASSDLDRFGMEGESIDVDFVTVPSTDTGINGVRVEPRVVPLIPFDELMLIETIGMGRVSTIYRAAWQNPMGVQMVALKVAMVNPETGDLNHINEIRNEADIASRLQHSNVCDLVGVAADAE